MISTLAVIGMIVSAVSGLASLALLLLFLRHVYDRGGLTDLMAAAKAVRQVHSLTWSAKLGRLLPALSAVRSTAAEGERAK